MKNIEVRPLRERNPKDCDKSGCVRVADWEVRTPEPRNLVMRWLCMEHAQQRVFVAAKQQTSLLDAD